MPISLGTSQPAQALTSGAAKLWILLIGVNQYQESSLPSLQFPAPDCQGLAQALEEATQAFPSKDLSIYHDFAAQLPTLAAVRKRLAQITQAAQSQDTVLIYFSGHGMVEGASNQVVLCLSDTRKQDLIGTGLPLSELLQALNQSLARQQLLWLDACHSGGMTFIGSGARSRDAVLAPEMPNPTQGLIELLRQRAALGQGFYALLSCDRNQRAWEFPELGHGVFTYYLMQGLQGAAADPQGLIDADGLYKYVYHQTLRHIDKANQQIRLVNRQKKSKGEQDLYQEYPLQTPKRIVEGMGEMVLGIRPQAQATAWQPHRRALIIDGLGSYQMSLALSKVLQSAGQFTLDYWPQPGKDWSTLKAAIVTSLNPAPTGDRMPTVLLYLRGKLTQSPEGEAWLVLTGNAQAGRLSRSWLRRTLRAARQVRQLVILDCPASEFLPEWIEDLQLAGEASQCIIAAAALASHREQFSQALLETLQQADAQVGLTAAAWIAQLQLHLADTDLARTTSQMQPLSWLSGAQGVIEVLPSQVGMQARAERVDLGLCPYMGLRAFGLEQCQYFYGREALIQQVLEQLRQTAALGVVGASGSGKSSLLQAGVLAQLYQGRHLPGSEQWWIRVIRLGPRPLQSLAQQLVDPGTERERHYQALQIEGLLYQGGEGFVQWLRSRPEPTVTLIIDQFEELFTLAPESERQPFLDLLFEGLRYAGDRFKLVIALRADFLPNCLAHAALAELLQQHSILVPPGLTPEAYREVILKPAEQVDLQIEPGLVDLLMQAVEQTAGALPLLEFLLEKLWEHRQEGTLTLAAYQQLGGLSGALERHAQAVYDSLDPAAQACARWIFLALTQLGEGTEDTRRRILKSDLVVAKYPAELVDHTLRVLTAAKLVMIRADELPPLGYSRGAGEGDRALPPESSSAESNPAESNSAESSFAESSFAESSFAESSSAEPTLEPIAEPTVEVVHESLIRHWSTLRWWLAENRSRLQRQRQLSQLAADWQQGQQHPDFLLTGGRLAEAEDLYIKYTDELPETVQRFIEAGLEARDQQQRLAKARLKKAQITAATLGLLGLVAIGLGALAYRQNVWSQRREIEALNASAEALLWSHQPLDSLQRGIRAGQQLQRWGWLQRQLAGVSAAETLTLQTASTLEQSLRFGRELNRLEAHARAANAVQFSLDGQYLASASDDGSVILWRPDGAVAARLQLAAEGARATDLALSQASSSSPSTAIGAPDPGKPLTLVIATSLGDLELWQVSAQGKGQRQKVFKAHPDWVSSVAISPDGEQIASASRDRTVKLWRPDGTLLKTLSGHSGWVNRVRYSPDGQTLASASEDKTIRLWQRDGSALKTLSGHRDRATDVAFSPDGQTLASASADGTFRLWDLPSGRLNYQVSAAEGTQAGQGENAAGLSPAAQNQLNAVAFSPDGQTLATAGANAQIQIWRTEDGLALGTLQGHSGEITGLSFRPAPRGAVLNRGLELASASTDATLRLWTLPPASGLSELGIEGLSMDPTGAYRFATADFEGTVTLWQVPQQRGSAQESPASVLQTFQGHQGSVEAVAFNPAGTELASVGSDGRLVRWRVADGVRLGMAVNPAVADRDSRLTAVAFSADGQLIATGGADHTVRLWAVKGDDLILAATLLGHTDEVTSIHFHPHRPLLLSGSYDRTVRLWQIPSARQIQDQLSGGGGLAPLQNQAQDKAALIQTLTQPDEAVSAVQFSPNGDRFAAASWDSQLYVWQLRGQSPQLRHRLGGHEGGVTSLAFSADGQLLISGSAQGSLQLWNPRTGERLQRLLGGPGAVNALGISADRQLLISGSRQGGVGLWRLSLPELLEKGCDRIGAYLDTNPTLSSPERAICPSSSAENQ